ncbi:hypothetical protein PPL_11524 [Heterostelium album PN500]|uniref:Ribosomal RNA-processing protein 8 n=1 Tax=Heterostelium pallidum (strain ATCC 26659 / Pp 5 / PN500) TaxID=670386 RepID=D3BTM7_HETP5|nr:hypothetical protein PPL_11524 [Heterostelium album PN500]EFA75444.1 hypothetical protein PPL_11524 [Heterostelium album PN500]|eukprot:XP_020427578.1 hypothetical protein PPL_11524 [Heterostelium album PN500]
MKPSKNNNVKGSEKKQPLSVKKNNENNKNNFKKDNNQSNQVKDNINSKKQSLKKNNNNSSSNSKPKSAHNNIYSNKSYKENKKVDKRNDTRTTAPPKKEIKKIDTTVEDNEKRSLWNPKPFGDSVDTSSISDSANKDESSKAFEKLDKHLRGSRFRYLNEILYTSESDKAFDEFKSDPTLFDQYHTGFAAQVEHWPINPLDLIIQDLQKLTQKNLVIADFGCGEARLAESLESKFKVHSFDLVAKNERVVACDVKNVPLPDKSVDIVVFCLSLMGTNFLDFIVEANRVLKPNGKLMIAEIESRITDNDLFVNEISNLQFKLSNKVADIHKKNQKNNNDRNIDSSAILKPCLYKKR